MSGTHETTNGDRIRLTVPVALLIFALGACGTTATFVWRAATIATELRLEVKELRNKNDELKEDLKTEKTWREKTREDLVKIEAQIEALQNAGWRPARR